jgi:hypothetical protein
LSRRSSPWSGSPEFGVAGLRNDELVGVDFEHGGSIPSVGVASRGRRLLWCTWIGSGRSRSPAVMETRAARFRQRGKFGQRRKKPGAAVRARAFIGR